MINEIIKEIDGVKSSSFYWKLKNKYLNYIIKETAFLENPTFNERLYCLLNNITEIQLCSNCSKKVKFTNYTKGYKKYCSLNCSRSSLEVIEKRKKTLLNKYDSLAPNPEKRRQTNLKKYGTEYPTQSTKVKNKTKKTNLKKYGVENVSQNKDINKKREQTSFLKFGVKTSLLDEKTKEKIKETNLKKYGTIYPTQTEEIKLKTKETNKNKYGVEFFTQSKKYQKKRINKFIENLDIILKQYSLKRNFQKKEYIGGYTSKDGKRIETNKYNILCLKCQKTFDVSLADGNIPTKCYVCEKQKSGTSIIEDEINNFLISLNIDFKRNNRQIIKPFELDFVTDNNFGIELNGLYYHSFEQLNKDNIKEYIYIENGLSPNKGQNFHLLKTLLAERKKIKLFHILENEWILKKDIVKSMIKYNVGKIDKKINARDLKIKSVSTIQAKIFLSQNHLQGETNASIRYALVDKDDNIFSLMTFSKNRYSDEDYELVRFSIRRDFIVRGAASKLLKQFRRDFPGKSIMTFADRRYSQGNIYENLGFEKEYILGPQYKYFKNGLVFHRMYFQKKNIEKLYKNYIDKKIDTSGFGLIKKYNCDFTARENLILNGIHKIYDSGHIKYTLK